VACYILVGRKARNDTYFPLLALLARCDLLFCIMAKLSLSFCFNNFATRGASQNIVLVYFHHTSCCGKRLKNGRAFG